jgi:hypothetical protein
MGPHTLGVGYLLANMQSTTWAARLSAYLDDLPGLRANILASGWMLVTETRALINTGFGVWITGKNEYKSR